LALVK
jgi:hypothetical protein